MSNKLTVGHVIGGLAILVVIALIVMFIVARATKQSGSAPLTVKDNLDAVKKELANIVGPGAIEVPRECKNRYYVPDEDRTPLSGEHSECTLTCKGTNVDRIDYANHHCENELDKALSSNAKKSGIAKYVADTGSYVDYVGCQIAGRVMPSQAPKIIYTKNGFVVDPGTCVLPPQRKLSDCSSTAQSTMLASTQMPMLGVTANEAEDIVKGLMKVIKIADTVINTGEDATAKFENAAQPIIMQVASIMNSIMNIIGISDDEALTCMDSVDKGINEKCENYTGILDRWKCYYNRFKSEVKTGKMLWNEANCLFKKFKAILKQINADVQDAENDAKTPVFRYKMIYRMLSASQNEINDEITKLATILKSYDMDNNTLNRFLPIDSNGNGNANMTSYETVQAAYELIFCHTDSNFTDKLKALIKNIYKNPCKDRQSFDASTNACTVKSSGKVTENYAPHDMSGHLPTMSAAGVW